MSMQTLPMLFINLGGEMMYILDQRLQAQKIQDDKATRVMNEIVSMMCNKKFIEELFKPQHLYSKKAMRTLFDRLAHASIMRLNAASMDKLYDLMLMSVKHQTLLCPKPSDLLLITLNHIDAIRSFVGDAQAIRQQVDLVYQLLLKTYGGMSSNDFYLIRIMLLNFLQDMHIRVSIFLKNKIQTASGRFIQPINGHVPWGTEIPGTITLYDTKGNLINKLSFMSGGDYSTLNKKGSLDLHGDRVTRLGCNIYLEKIGDSGITTSGSKTSTMLYSDLSTPDPMAMAQLDLLAQLIGANRDSSLEFKVNLFESEDDNDTPSVQAVRQSSVDKNVIKINAMRESNSELQRIMGEMNIGGGTNADDEDDLLDLMDSAIQQ